MRKIYTILVFCSFVFSAFAQQEQQNTQFMYNKQSYNPGFVGSADAGCFTAIVRRQWLEVDGAPEVQVLNFHTPLLGQRVGVGGGISRQVVGITENITANAAYAYRLRLGNGYLGIGIDASIRSLKNNYGDSRLVGTQAIDMDPSIPGTQVQKFIFNFGSGLYYNGEKFYIGVSSPRLLNTNIDFATEDPLLAREEQHYYLMGGTTFPVGENVKLQPQVLVKYVQNAPLDADANLTAIFNDRFMVGASYRLGGASNSGLGESVDLLVGAYINEHLVFGLSYDLTLSGLKDYTSGSIEAMVRYCLGDGQDGDYLNPRFF